MSGVRHDIGIVWNCPDIREPQKISPKMWVFVWDTAKCLVSTTDSNLTTRSIDFFPQPEFEHIWTICLSSSESAESIDSLIVMESNNPQQHKYDTLLGTNISHLWKRKNHLPSYLERGYVSFLKAKWALLKPPRFHQKIKNKHLPAKRPTTRQTTAFPTSMT